MKNIKQAIEHFQWKFKNSWKPTPKDLEAFNTIVDFVNSKHAQQIKQQQLFGKLQVTYYGELLKYYQSTVFDSIPQKELHKQLDKSWDEIFEDFINKHQMIEMSLLIPKEHRDKHPKELKRLGIDIKSVSKLDKEETEKNLTSQINYALNQYNKQKLGVNYIPCCVQYGI